MTEKLKFTIKEKFEEYAHLNVAFITSDGSMFEKKDDAITHAGLIDNPETYEVRREKDVIAALLIFPETELVSKVNDLARKAEKLEILRKEVEDKNALIDQLETECSKLQKSISKMDGENPVIAITGPVDANLENKKIEASGNGAEEAKSEKTEAPKKTAAKK